jgi:putative nucleotidyltransferase with HDIG domain
MKPTQEQLEFGTTTLLVALSARNLETGGHAQRVSKIALDLARAMDLAEPQLKALKFGGLLHDVGKLTTPDSILCKPTGLTANEWAIMREHPSTGASMLRALDFPEPVWLIVEQHHERFDGEGYPYGLRGQQITLEARIFAVADTFDAITADRCYREGAAPAVALHEIASWAGQQFDPVVVEAFIKLMRPNQSQTLAA